MFVYYLQSPLQPSHISLVRLYYTCHNPNRGNNIKFSLPHCSKDVFKHSFLPVVLRGWNVLPQLAVEAISLDLLKASLPSVTNFELVPPVKNPLLQLTGKPQKDTLSKQSNQVMWSNRRFWSKIPDLLHGTPSPSLLQSKFFHFHTVFCKNFAK